MTIAINDALANALLKGGTVDAALTGGFIYFYAGAVPATADTALDLTPTTGTHTQLAKVAADAVAVIAGTRGLQFAASSASRALAKLGTQTWAAVIKFIGKDQASAGVSPLTATFYRFVAGVNLSGLAPPVQSAASTSASGGTLAAATYYYIITALNALGESLSSNEVSIVTSGATSSNTLTWTAPPVPAGEPPVTGYRVYRGTAAGGENVYYVLGNVLTYLDTNAASTGGTAPTRDAGSTAGTSTASRLQGSIATSGGDINLTSVSLSDNGTNTVGLSTFEIRVAT